MLSVNTVSFEIVLHQSRSKLQTRELDLASMKTQPSSLLSRPKLKQAWFLSMS